MHDLTAIETATNSEQQLVLQGDQLERVDVCLGFGFQCVRLMPLVVLVIVRYMYVFGPVSSHTF